MGPGPRRKAALWAKGEPLGGRGRVYPGPGVWLGMAPLSAAGRLGLCWPPDVRWLQPAGPPPHAQRGFIKSGCEEAREAAWLQPAGSAPHPACSSQGEPKAAAPLCTDGDPACLGVECGCVCGGVTMTEGPSGDGKDGVQGCGVGRGRLMQGSLGWASGAGGPLHSRVGWGWPARALFFMVSW